MHNTKLNRQSGLSLMEVMIALLIGLLLLLGITSMFMSNKRIYKEQAAMSRLQENARFAIEMMMRDIRMASYSGCNNDISTIINNLTGSADDDLMVNFTNPVEGSESKGNWLPSNSTDIVDDDDTDHDPDPNSRVVAGTDGITVRYLKPTDVRVDTMGNAANPIPTQSVITASDGIVDGNIIAVADCERADIIQLTADPVGGSTLTHATGDTDPPPGNSTNDASKLYDDEAIVAKYVSRRYYLGNGSGNWPSLYRVTNGGLPQELIDGVQQMQILYGEDTNGSDMVADTYVTATNVTNWNNVVSVRLAMLFVTPEPNNQIDPDTNSYTLLGGTGAGGATIAAQADFNRRRVFTTTIQIRNRIGL